MTTDERSVRRFGGWSIAMMQEKPTAEYVLASDYDAERLARLQAQHERDCVVETLMHAKALLVTAMAAGHEPLPWSWQQEAAAFVNGPAPDVGAPKDG